MEGRIPLHPVVFRTSEAPLVGDAQRHFAVDSKSETLYDRVGRGEFLLGDGS
jgi:hypothetical protein